MRTKLLSTLLLIGHGFWHCRRVMSGDHWASFWREAGVHGCTDGFPVAAQQQLADAWRAEFAACADEHVLDIGCGRGALFAHARGAGLDGSGWLGVDLAAVEGVDFAVRGGVDAAALPFADRSFAVTVSQFGVEYAGLAGALVEAGRVTGRRLMTLVHAADGVLVRQAAEQVAQIDWLLDELALGARLRRHFSAASEASAADVDALLAAIVARAGRDANASLLEATWHGVMATQEAPGGALPAVSALEAALLAHRARLAAMVAAAPDAAQMVAAAEGLERRGFRVEIEEARVRGEAGGSILIGRWLRADRILGE